MIVYWIKLCI